MNPMLLKIGVSVALIAAGIYTPGNKGKVVNALKMSALAIGATGLVRQIPVVNQVV